MASVYYLLDDATHIGDYIIQIYSQQDENLKEKHHAATMIQRTWRKHKARVAYTKMVRAAVVFQKYTRGWLVRFHLPDMYEEYFDKISLKRYQWAATMIQKVWRGFLVRMQVNLKELMHEKKKAKCDIGMRISFEMQSKAVEMKDSDLDEIAKGEGLPGGQEILYMRSIMEMMFDRHHLLSTKLREGVLGVNTELQEVEKFLSKLSWSGYMKELRKLYNQYKKYEKCERPSYLFKDKMMMREEDTRRLRDTRNDLKEVNLGCCVADNRKPFCMQIKKTRPHYAQSIMSDGRYVPPIRAVTRTDDPSKNVCAEDFYLSLKDIGDKCQVPPYYIDFWYKECTGHYYRQ
ncbi:uncharacterized protein LOC126747635 [Anthonomus grandis grandis]|uniref:uncharacterized protein LOC126747635 n=1 Tax=Anthonomus grandis grandis TaxID=2921223 RepID=UPI002166A095|nr:uncharacterized protein LOC126747635 [Anthonomus grandis grandis]